MYFFRNFRGVEGTSHQRRRKYRLEALLLPRLPKILELFRGHEPHHGMVLPRRLQVLAQGQKIAGNLPQIRHHLENFIPLLEAGINDIILIGAGIFFLVSAETRIKRRRVLNSLHRLRVFAHIIDMHQLHKDPERVMQRGELAPSTPQIEMSAFELSRYLDYCSELLSLAGIIAGLYAQNSEDAVLIDAVSDIEQLTNGISRKIWQKLMILDLLDSRDQLG